MQCCCNQHVFAPRKARPFVRLATRLDENFQGGYTPQQIRSAYDFPANSTGLGQTIALITTGLQPNIESDLSFFSSFFSLPAARLTIRRIGAVPEVLDSDWALETTLDVEWAHALAPEADLLLVYAASDRIGDLMQAADLAAGLGADVISMSWGEQEHPGQSELERVFRLYPSTAFVGSAGDQSAVPFFPSTSGLVLSAGGTSLVLSDTGERISEIAWYSGGCARRSPHYPAISLIRSPVSTKTDSSPCTEPTPEVEGKNGTASDLQQSLQMLSMDIGEKEHVPSSIGRVLLLSPTWTPAVRTRRQICRLHQMPKLVRSSIDQ